MKWLLSSVLLLTFVGCLTGCNNYKQRGNSEWGFKYETKWAFYQTTDLNSEGTQESEFEWDIAIVDKVVDGVLGVMGPPEPAPTETAP